MSTRPREIAARYSTGSFRPGVDWMQLETPLRSEVDALLSDRRRGRFLAGLSPKERDAVLSASVHRRVSRDTVVTHQGDPAEQLFLLIHGLARHFFITPTGRKIYLLWLSPGETFGGVSVLEDPGLYLVGTEVVKGSDVLVWSRDAIRHLAAQYPKVFENGLATAVDYLAWFLAAHLSLVCHTAKERLAHVLFSLAKGIGESRPDGIHLEVTNEQLANTANITLFTVSRYLNAWQRNGVLLKLRGKIILRSPKRLFI